MPATHATAWWRIINWRLVGAAGIPAWLLVAGIVVWAKAHPRTPPTAWSEFRPRPPLLEVAPMARRAREESPDPRPVREVAALPRRIAEVAPVPRAAAPDPSDERVADAFVQLIEHLAQFRANGPGKRIPLGCKTHGTAIHFTRSTVEAVKQAKKQDKLVFVLHLSGNIEDDGFT